MSQVKFKQYVVVLVDEVPDEFGRQRHWRFRRTTYPELKRPSPQFVGPIRDLHAQIFRCALPIGVPTFRANEESTAIASLYRRP